MSKDKDFRDLMTDPNDTVRDEIWNEIKNEILNETNVIVDSSNTLAVSQHKMTKKKIIWIFGIIVFIAIISLSSFFIWKHINSPKLRYCTINDYYVEDTSITIKEYVDSTNKNMQYIDWYEDIEYFYAQHFKLNTNDETICLYEQVVSKDGYFCHLYVTDNLTELDVLSSFTLLCQEEIKFKNLNLLYGIEAQDSYVMFEYQQYKYYLKVEGNLEQSYILGLVNDLLETK